MVTVENLMRNSGGIQRTQQDQSTHTQDERQDLCLENGTSKSIWVWNYRIYFLEEMLLQERELCTLHGVMDAKNFNILWTEASWVGNKTLTPHYPNQGNHLYLKQIPSKAHILILLIEKWNNIPSDQGRQTNKQTNKKTACLGGTLSLFCPLTWWVHWQVQWSLEGHRVTVITLVRLFRNNSGGFLFVWIWGGVYGWGRLISMGELVFIHPL